MVDSDKIATIEMSGRPRTTSFAEGNKQPLNPPLGGMKISSKYLNRTYKSVTKGRACLGDVTSLLPSK